MAEYQVKAPIVFIIFNRPETTKKVFEKIRAAKPTTLLVIADGPRPGRENDTKNCMLTREIVGTIDWNCQVLTNFSENNLGCRYRVASGITWAFDQVERAIILEDDCVPGDSFFRFCDELLEKFKDNPKVMHITGSNFIGSPGDDVSYFFSQFPHVWGWASWRRAWQKYDVDILNWPSDRSANILKNNFKKKRFIRYWTRKFDQISSGFNTWDYQWTYACLKNHGLCIIPRVNLITNIGFDLDATHTLSLTENANLEVHELKTPLVHPSELAAHFKLDDNYMKKTASFWRRLIRRLHAQLNH